MDVPENAPEHCPGTESQDAGKSNACQGCPNQQVCLTAPKGPDPDLPQISSRLSSVRNKILVLSGKGGVGKSTVASQIAFALSSQGNQVGILDIDICGPSIPKMLGIEREQVHQSNLGWSPVYVEDIAVMSIAFMLQNPNTAVVWRGPKKKKNGMIKQFIRDVDWGELDYLIIDTPPGTSDEHLSITQLIKDSCNLQKDSSSGMYAVIVTTPQEVSLSDVRKEVNFCKKISLPIIGVVENMSSFICRKCKTETQIFPPTTGGAKALCEKYNLNFLGSLPLEPLLTQSCDEGIAFWEKLKQYRNQSQITDTYQSLTEKAFLDIINKFQELIESKEQSVQ